jgi:hypothetical protein
LIGETLFSSLRYGRALARPPVLFLAHLLCIPRQRPLARGDGAISK